jgi:uncharacterized membrane protein
LSNVSASLPAPPLATPPARRSLFFVGSLIAYALLLCAAFVTGNTWLGVIAVWLLTTLLLWPALRRRSVPAWGVWLAAVTAFGVLAARGNAHAALDGLPIMINAALCFVFAHTLADGHEPLIARIIAEIEGPQHLALPGVATYARRLTWAWAIVLGTQAVGLTVLLAWRVPDGVFATFGIVAPIKLSAVAWGWWLHAGSYALVFAFLLLEYAFRRWHLRHVEQMPLPQFIARLAQCWPALVRSFADQRPRGR